MIYENERQPRIQNYLSSICMQILHKDKIKNKLEHCLNEIIENQISRGIPEEEAIDSAIGQLGDPCNWEKFALAGVLIHCGLILGCVIWLN